MKNEPCRHTLKSSESRSCLKCGCYMDLRNSVTGLKSPLY
jgi:hypothetical protein